MEKMNVDIKPKIKKLEIITKKKVKTLLKGNYMSSFKGRGLEFENYREYTPSDDAKSIDWRASVRSNKLLIREFVEERNIQVFFLIDVSSSMLFGSTEKLKNEYVAEFIGALSYTILDSGDSVGFALFNDKVLKFSPPKPGKKQFYVIAKNLMDPKNYGGKYNIEFALRYVFNILPQDTLVVMVSDFIGFKDEWIKRIALASKKFDLIAFMVKDPRDKELPKDSQQVLISDPFSGQVLLIDPSSIREKYGNYVKQQEDHIRSIFRSFGIDMMEITTDKDYIIPMISFFKKRQKKWR